MKIKELQIRNFRNLVSTNLMLNQTVSILSGKNGLGKSNALNAASYGITGVILTDKWGTGENDIDSIIPSGATKGINPEVSIIMESGTKFSKKYVSQWSKDGSKVKGHTTEWYINDVPCKNETEFNEQFYSIFNYNPSLKTKEVNELRLFTDPLYALQKLDAKQLRQLLVDLGCSVTTEELYQQGFGDLRPYGDKYLGKWDVMRKNLKDEIKTFSKEIESLNAKLETVAVIDDYDEENLKELNKAYEDLIAKKAVIQSGSENPEIKVLETQIAEIRASVNAKVEARQTTLEAQRAALQAQRNAEIQRLKASAEGELNPLKEELTKVKAQKETQDSLLKASEQAFIQYSEMMANYIALAQGINDKKAKAAIKLETTRNSSYKNMITCPICGSDFPASPEEQAASETHKRNEIEALIEEIESLENSKTEFKAKYDEAKVNRDKAKENVNKATMQLQEVNSKILELEGKIASVKVSETSKALEDIDSEIEKLEEPVDVAADYTKIAEFKNKIQALKNADAAKVQDEVDKINLEISELNSEISEEYVKKSKTAEKKEYEAKLKATVTELNNSESLLARCNRLIQTMINMINKKATEKTGLTFVMLEENLSNDGIKEVCYAIVDNIPFKDVNTAKKIIYGIKFIEKLKDLLGHNDLPILADRMEGIDSIDTIKNLTKEQLICTRVSEEKEITIL